MITTKDTMSRSNTQAGQYSIPQAAQKDNSLVIESTYRNEYASKLALRARNMKNNQSKKNFFVKYFCCFNRSNDVTTSENKNRRQKKEYNEKLLN
jgi:hypothetical protein